MAALDRRTWADLKAEAARRIYRSGVTDAEARVEEWLAAANLDLGLLYHHFELDDEDTSVTCSTSVNSVDLPANTYAVIAVQLRAVTTGVFKATLSQDTSWSNLRSFTGQSKAPSTWMRFGDKLYFDSIPDAAYPLTIWRYQEPTAPDFASGSPEIGRLWDEHLIEYVCVRAGGAYTAEGFQGSNAPLLTDFLDKVAQPKTAESPLGRLGPHPSRAVSHGGAQG